MTVHHAGPDRLCRAIWGSHACDLPAGHTGNHACIDPVHDETGEPYTGPVNWDTACMWWDPDGEPLPRQETPT